VDATERTLQDDAPPSMSTTDVLLAGRYRIKSILGRGGMGTVYRVEDTALGETIALKIIAQGSSTPANLERQRDEVKLARRVTHPNVARTFDIGEHGDLRFITMELVDGTSLRDVIGSDTKLDNRLALLAHVASGLAAIHEADIAHRDLKPENVLVSSAGIAKITDFGIARTADSVASGMTSGTPRYMAPEVLAGAAPTRAADVYAFGLIAYETVTGERFHGGDPEAAARVLRGRLSRSSEDITAFIMRCLGDTPDARPVSVRTLVALLAGAPSCIALGTDVARVPRIRLGAAVFASDQADSWLSDSIPSEMLRSLARSRGLEVVSALLPQAGTAAAAHKAGIDVVVQGTVRREGGELHLSVRAVSMADQLQLWARSSVLPAEHLAAGVEETAGLVTLAVLGTEKTARTMRAEDPRVTELLLRASHEEHSPWRDFQSQAAELLEQARVLAPDDPIVLSALTHALLGGAGAFDAERFHRARLAAAGAVELDGADPDCQLALAVTLFVANDPLGAMTSLSSVLRAAPSVPDGHAMTAALAVDVGLFRDGVGRAALVRALDPGLAIARTVAALAHEYLGEHDAADAVIDDGLHSDAPLAQVFALISAARCAMWRGKPGDIDALHARLRDRAHLPFVAPFLRALEGTITGAEAISSMGPFASMAKEWARPRCLRLQFEAELFVHHGSMADAAKIVDELIAAGMYDSSWLTLCPSMQRLAASVDLSQARERVVARAAAVRRAMEESGLTGSVRRTPVRRW
jgi:hypothetical protein